MRIRLASGIDLSGYSYTELPLGVALGLGLDFRGYSCNEPEGGTNIIVGLRVGEA